MCRPPQFQVAAPVAVPAEPMPKAEPAPAAPLAADLAQLMMDLVYPLPAPAPAPPVVDPLASLLGEFDLFASPVDTSSASPDMLGSSPLSSDPLSSPPAQADELAWLIGDTMAADMIDFGAPMPPPPCLPPVTAAMPQLYPYAPQLAYAPKLLPQPAPALSFGGVYDAGHNARKRKLAAELSDEELTRMRSTNRAAARRHRVSSKARQAQKKERFDQLGRRNSQLRGQVQTCETEIEQLKAMVAKMAAAGLLDPALTQILLPHAAM